MKKKGFFITGTDTGVGKTWATLYLMRVLQAQGLKVAGMKPVATGAFLRGEHWVNEDALALRRAAPVPLPYERVNPYVFEPPASPHIAAELAGETIELPRLVEACAELQEVADCVLVEGVGGWKVPLNRRETVADLAVALGLPVILVVGLRLGCLNHALLTHAAIRSSGARFAGWIANHPLRDFPYASENIRTLTAALECPPLLDLAYCEDSRQPGQGLGSGRAADEILRLLAP